MYYEDVLQAQGLTVHGVDWNGPASQSLRFKILSEIDNLNRKRIHDVGCGLGHLNHYFKEKGVQCEYVGSDISSRMIDGAKELDHGGEYYVGDILQKMKPSWMKADYVLASGLFFVRSDAEYREWQQFVEEMIRGMFELANEGIGFNLLTSLVDYEESHLYYSPPSRMLDFCLRNLSNKVVIRHDYPLYEYTVYVYR